MGTGKEDVQDLEIEAIIGFDGHTPGGLVMHPDRIHMVYSLGCKVVIQNWKTKKQHLLNGHTNVITSVAISPDGKKIASGQVNFMGFKALVILWDFKTRSILGNHEIHKVRIESVIFSCDNKYLISLGGRDDCNIVVFNVEKCEPMCGYIASRGTAGNAEILRAMTRRGSCFASGGNGTLRLWKISVEDNNVRAVDVQIGKLKRQVICMQVDHNDEFMYCGTTSGDLLKIRLNYAYETDILEPISDPKMVGCYGKYNPAFAKKPDPVERYSSGITAIELMPTESEEYIILGGGDGLVEVVIEKPVNTIKTGRLKLPSLPYLHPLRSAKLDSKITSFNLLDEDILVGTDSCEIYSISVESFQVTLIITCHKNSIYDVAFPYNYSDVFATASKDDIRIWKTDTSTELLRIVISNFTCTSLVFARDGKSIVSGWNDGFIRAFTPESGRLIYAIPNAHNKGVSAVTINSSGTQLVTGGMEGQVRIWEINPTYQKLIGTLNEHRNPVTSLQLLSDTEAASSSTDGSCIIWDIVRMCRNQIMFSNSQVLSVRYHTSGVQVLSTGTDRKVSYWEVIDGSLIREVEASTASAINSLNLSPRGDYFVTGGNDMIIKFWLYQEGITTHVGLGHAAVISQVIFSPDAKYIISVSIDGSIFRWKSPFPEHPKTPSVCLTPSSRSTCSVREEKWANQGISRDNSTRSKSSICRSSEKEDYLEEEDVKSSRKSTPSKSNEKSESEQRDDRDDCCHCGDFAS